MDGHRFDEYRHPDARPGSKLAAVVLGIGPDGNEQRLAARMDPDGPNRVAFHLYEDLRPEVPEGTRGWGARGEPRLDRMGDAAP